MKSVKGFIAVITAAASVSQYAMPVITASAAYMSAPVLWYDFTDGAKDASGNGNNGTVYGAALSNGKAHLRTRV